MFKDLEGRIGHQFQNSDLLKVALTHRSYYFENKKTSPGHFERLEFLGDAVLDMVLSEMLMTRFTSVVAVTPWVRSKMYIGAFATVF